MTVEQRLDQLARRNKRLTVALTMTVVAMCAVVTMAATGEKRGDFDIVTARYINVKNETGDYVVRLRANPEGQGEISTHSAKGNDLVVLTATVDGNGKITTYHPDGKTLVKLSGTVKGGIVKTYQPNGTGLVSVSTSDNGGLINVYNKTGEGIANMYADEYGNGVVYAGNRKGKGRTLQPGP